MNQKVLAAYFCTDALSGVSSCAGTMADGAGIPTSRSGPQTFAVTATDIAGNVTTKSVTYTVIPPATTPVFSLKTRTYSGAQAVTITDKTPGAVIYYTVDGTTPTSSSSQYPGSAITIGSSETLNADALAACYARSAVRGTSYTIAQGASGEAAHRRSVRAQEETRSLNLRGTKL
jgi:hypothetical protein